MKFQITFVAVLLTQLNLVSYADGKDLPADFCEGNPAGLLAHPDDCTKFIFCMNDIPYINTCPYPVLVFYDGFCVEG